MGNIAVANQFFDGAGSPSIQAYYGPHASLVDALAAIPPALRTVGRIVGIRTGNLINDYKLEGFDDTDLAVKTALTTDAFTSAGGSGGGEVIVDPLNLPVNAGTLTFLNANYSANAIGLEVYDTVNRFMYKKIGATTWAKTAAVDPDSSLDPAGVIQGVNLIAHK